MTHHFSVRSLRSGAVAAVAAVVLVGCNGGTDPEESPTTAPTTAEVTTPSPTETEPTEEPTTEEPTEEPTETSALPELPEEAKENTPEGAEAFIRYYFDVLNQLHQEPEAGVIDSLVDPACESCVAAEESIGRLLDEGSYLSGDLYEIGALAPIGGGVIGVQRFDATWTGPGASVMSHDGEELEVIPPREFKGIMAALWEGDRWVFYDSAVSE